jgi:hypothetical protein
MCDQQDETISHLLTSCAFARQVWLGLLQRVGFLALMQHNRLFEDIDGALRVSGFLPSSRRASTPLWCWAHG